MRELHLFAGAGGGILGGLLCGHIPVCAVELEEYPRRVLLQRQRDGVLPWFPVWDDVCTFDGRPWRGRVDLIAGGFPCQDISSAGRGDGIEGERSGLWSEFARIIGEVRPQFVLVENSPWLAFRGLGRVLGDLSILGFDAEWDIFGADDVGAPHLRKRIFILANSNKVRRKKDELEECGPIKEMGQWAITKPPQLSIRPSIWDDAKFETMGLSNGMAPELGAIEALGNGQVPAVVKLAWETLKCRLTLNAP